MAGTERVTVTLPGELVREIDRLERNRSRFVLQAIQRELQRRRRAELRRSLGNPHPDTGDLVEDGFYEWARSLPAEEAAGLVDVSTGTAVRWIPGEGWVKADE